MGNRCPLVVGSTLVPGLNRSALLIALLICLCCVAYGQDSCSAKCTSSDSPCTGLTGSAYGQCVTHCKQVCGQPPSPAATPDPRCSNRNAQGKITCTINKPNVTQHETAYPEVQFAPGDIVDIWADGCVQTGGLGNTWKRYVNPSGQGRNQQTLYHGLVRLPGGALVTVQSLLGRHNQLPSTGVPLPSFVLHLGYDDDDYSDNSYNDHDDGTDDQCKTFGFNYGGPAYVTITIYRGVQPDLIASRYDFDLESNTTDPNGFPYNPQWSWQLRPGNQGKIPSTASCHEFSERPTTLGLPSRHMAPSFSDCTDQTDTNNVDMPVGINGDLCDAKKTPETGGTVTVGSFVGHVNWFPVTVEGNAGWGDHGDWLSGGDDDYTFTFRSETGGPVVPDVNDSSDFHLHVEFDSDETIDHFTSDAWSAFRNAVDHLSKQQAAELFNGHTILTGMFGLDAEHNLKAELHPLYAIATRTVDTPEDEMWLIFVRNRGDEGFCSSYLWDAGFEDYTFHLPWREGMASVAVDSVKTQFEGTDQVTQPVYKFLPPDVLQPNRLKDAGVYVTFHLGPANNNPFIDGALHLAWTSLTPNAPPTSVVTGAARTRQPQGDHSGQLIAAMAMNRRTSAEDHDEIEKMIAAAVKQLTPDQQAEVKRAKGAAVTRAVSVHRLPPGGPIQKISTLPAAMRIPRLHAIKAGPATEKAARETALMHALCAATHNAPAGLPAGICQGTVRDHR